MSTSQIAKERLLARNGNSANKKKKILLKILLPITIIVAALIIFLGCWFGCTKKGTGDGGDNVTTIGRPVPYTTEYYKFEADDVTKPVLGWSDEVLSDYADAGNKTKLADFDVMDLSGKNISGNCSFGYLEPNKKVFERWSQLKTIDLSNTNWEVTHDSDGEKSGKNTFQSITSNSVETINLSGANFVCVTFTNETCYNSASRTFASCTFTQLKTLNLSYAKFATDNQTKGFVRTADGTFQSAEMNSLTTLNLNGTIFCADNMLKDSNSLYDSSVAASTFGLCKFGSLVNIDLSTAIFSCRTTGSLAPNTKLNTLNKTFWNTTFTALTKLDLSQTDLSKYAGVDTNTSLCIPAVQTFSNAYFYNLLQIDLSNVGFYDGSGSELGSFVSSSTFGDLSNKNWSNVTKLKITCDFTYWQSYSNKFDDWFDPDSWEPLSI